MLIVLLCFVLLWWYCKFFVDSNNIFALVLQGCYICKKPILGVSSVSLQWRHNGSDSVSNHQPHDCFLNRLFRRRSKKTSKLRVTGLCAGNSPGTGEFPAQMASNAENVSIWWRHHVWSKLEGKIDLYQTTRRHNKALTVCIFLEIYWISGGLDK